jgi:hypothetical protein
LVAPEAEGHPVDFGTKNVAKYIILMTDGANTHQFDLKPAYKSGPSSVWYSDARAELNGEEYYQGFLVEMPNNAADQRFYAPGSPWDTSDDTFVSVTEMNSTFDDARQWSHPEVYRRFQTEDAARYFFENSGDAAAFAEYMDVLDDIGGYDEADTDLKAICDQAKEQDYIKVFSVAFEAPPAGDAVLSYCASKPGDYFDVNGPEIQSAFDAIAAQISQLRLTE